MGMENYILSSSKIHFFEQIKPVNNDLTPMLRGAGRSTSF